jgi:hypothetical protein
MTDKERESFLAFMEEYKEKMRRNPELARRFLINIGLYTEDGDLTERYQHYARPCSTIETV